MAVTDVSSSVNTTVSNEIGRQVFGTPDGQPTRTLVQQGWSQAQAYAQSAFTAATTFLNSLAATASTIATLEPIDQHIGDIDAITTALSAFTNTPPAFTPTLVFADSDYSSPELSHLIANLDTWVQGTATGLPAAVEAAIWQRGRVREAVNASKKQQEVVRQFATRGFTKPPGAMAIELLEASQEAQDADSTFSRDVAIKQAELEQSNRRFAFEQAGKVQEALMGYMQDKMRRALEAVRSLSQFLTEAYGHQVQGFSAQANYAGSRNSSEAAYIRAQSDVKIAQANIRVEASRANLQALIERARMLLESVRASAQVSAQLAAAALSSVNLSGGLHDSTSWGLSVSESRSRSVSATESTASNRQDNYTP